MKVVVAAGAIVLIVLALRKLVALNKLYTCRKNENHQSQINAILDNLPLLAWCKDSDGRYFAVNQPFLKLLGVTRKEVLGKTDGELWPQELALAYQREDQKVLKTAQQTKFTALMPFPGQERWVETYKSPVFLPNNKLWGTMGISLDITELKIHEEKIYQIAYFDDLTNLPNRKFINKRVAGEMKLACRGKAAGAVLFIDINDLKLINDTLGHSYGDKVIQTAGMRISAEVGDTAVVARAGGGEFIVLLPNADTRDKVEGIAGQIVKALSKDYIVSNPTSYISVNIGIALYPSNGINAEDILKNADTALYVAKKDGKNNWRFYDADMLMIAYENMLLKRNLRDANKRDELFVYYQPQITIQDRSIIGYEALLRWHSPEHGSVPPERFIPLAEETDTIHEIGDWVLNKACGFARSLAAMGKDSLCVWVNVSPRQLNDDDFVATVGRAIATANIKPCQLGLEITENVLIGSLDDCVEKLHRLQTLGVNLSLDDFGTGYSSLTYLRSLPVKALKIDKSFIDRLACDEAQVAFVQLIIEMAHKIGLTVVAEGVETELQLERLRNCACDYIQGYVFSQPLPAEDAISLLPS